jgi:hypothetical protein
MCPNKRSIYIGTLLDTPGNLAISDLDFIKVCGLTKVWAAERAKISIQNKTNL